MSGVWYHKFSRKSSNRMYVLAELVAFSYVEQSNSGGIFATKADGFGMTGWWRHYGKVLRLRAMSFRMPSRPYQ
jgi:hypothetical protein